MVQVHIRPYYFLVITQYLRLNKLRVVNISNNEFHGFNPIKITKNLVKYISHLKPSYFGNLFDN